MKGNQYCTTSRIYCMYMYLYHLLADSSPRYVFRSARRRFYILDIVVG